MALRNGRRREVLSRAGVCCPFIAAQRRPLTGSSASAKPVAWSGSARTRKKVGPFPYGWTLVGTEGPGVVGQETEHQGEEHETLVIMLPDRAATRKPASSEVATRTLVNPQL